MKDRVVAFLNGAGGAFAMAVVVFALALVGHATLGVALLLSGVIVAYGLLLLFGRRIEMISVLAAPQSDERTYNLHMRAAAASAHVLALVIVGGYLYDLARGAGDHSMWAPLGGLFGVVYLLSLLVFVRMG
jgi:hypothetical protein